MSALLAVVLVGLTVFLAAYAVLDFLIGRTPEQRRIASLRVFTQVERKPGEPITAQLRAIAGHWIEQSPLLTRMALRSEPLLDQTNHRAKPDEWLAIRFGVALVTIVVGMVIFPLWLALVLGVAGFHVPNLVLKRRIKKRRAQFADDLPGMLHLMLSSLRSGFTLQQAVEAAVRDDTGPVAEELSRALNESRISGEFEDALERVGERLGSNEVVWLVMALRLQKEVGGSLAEVMQTTADTMRERAYLRRQVRTLSAEGRFSAYILVAMPIGIGVFLFMTRRDYMAPLFTDPIGILLLVVAVLLLTTGGFWLRAAVKITV